MKTINSKYLGMASGITGVFLYLGCWILMALLGEGLSIKFFNLLLHGLDVGSVIRMDISPGDSFQGLLLTFVVSWLTGYILGTSYNLLSRKTS